MNKYYIIFLLFAITSCQKNTKTVVSNDNASFFDLSIFERKIKIDSTIINASKNKELIQFYQRNYNETVWESEELRKLVIQEFENCENEGLNPQDYNYKSIKSKEENYSDLNDENIIAYDFLLTESMQTYISHISKGKLNPMQLYDDYDLKEKTVDVNGILTKCLKETDFKETLENCKPKHQNYKDLVKSLAYIRSLGEDNTTIIDTNEVKLMPGKSYPSIKTIKQKLLLWKDSDSLNTSSIVYDKKMIPAVKRFQKRHGLISDGIIGKNTIQEFNYSKQDRIKQLYANLERWRWFNNDFGSHYLISNIPNYQIVAIKNNDTTLVQNIVVGKPSRRTPVLESKISNINLNPSWTVPPTILAEDVFPDAEKNRAAFSKQRLKIYDWKKNEISAWKWTMEEANKYHYVQAPGKNNALGLMKINFPNKFSVYMHDTNHRNLFKLKHRSLSSGCVRLEKPMEMAAYILNDTVNWPLKKINDTTDINYYIKLKKEKLKIEEKKDAQRLAKNPLLVILPKKFVDPVLKTIVIPVKEEILIHQLYFTSWLQNGKVQFRRDIYNLDLELYNKLRN